MSARSLPVRTAAAAALVGAATLTMAACSSGAGDGGRSDTPVATPPITRASSVPASTVTVTTTAAATSVAESTSAASTTSDDSVTLAVRACRQWKAGDGKSAAEGSGDYDRAAKTAAVAARQSSRFEQLAKDMTFVSGLPLTSNTPSDIAKAQRATPRIAATCEQLGVSGIVHG